MNRYPRWKYVLIGAVLAIGVLYALPNLYGEAPAIQISAKGENPLEDGFAQRAQKLVEAAEIKVTRVQSKPKSMLLVLGSATDQLKAAEVLRKAYGKQYGVALNLAPRTPPWLVGIGADPMVLGLDLRGGVHFLMEVDMDAAKKQQQERFVSDVRTLLRRQHIRYITVGRAKKGIRIVLRSQEDADKTIDKMRDEAQELDVKQLSSADGFELRATVKEQTLADLAKTALQQNITTLRNRINELGVAEPIVQQQGNNRIVVELPGVQDTVRAKQILGATATLEYRLVAEGKNVLAAEQKGLVPAGTRLYHMSNGQPILLNKRLIVSGNQLIDAASGYDQRSGSPMVSVTLNSAGAKRMRDVTTENVGTRMAVVFIERKPVTKIVDGKKIKHTEVSERVINAATIQEPFGRRFQTTGLGSAHEASELALLLRAGALAAPVEIIEERTVGPSLGQDNIERGFLSVVVGLVVVLLFMAVYYRRFGLYADIALMANLVLIVALLSLLGATLTMPGIAGIVLTVGMAVDANVLISERIREELRNGNSPQSSIKAGYEKALSTIADANITTFIAAIVLFSFGTGPIKGFAVTLSIGILTSMFTAIMGTRALVNLTYGHQKHLMKVSI